MHPLRGISLEDRAAQAKELAAFWARQSQQVHDKLLQLEVEHDKRSDEKENGLTSAEVQSQAGKTCAVKDEGDEISSEAKQGQGPTAPHEAQVRPVEAEIGQEQ